MAALSYETSIRGFSSRFAKSVIIVWAAHPDADLNESSWACVPGRGSDRDPNRNSVPLRAKWYV